MKCAAELITLKKVAEAEYQAEEHRKDLEALLAFQQMKENAINFCETTINSALIEKAQNRQQLSMSFKIEINKDRLGNKFFYCIARDKHTYANGNPSYYPDSSIGYAFDTLIDYLREHCFEIRNDYCTYPRYGCGNCGCCEITVFVNKLKCIE